jgi:colanic acid/amylovoran biosynthesis glycosyltransferase
VGLLAGHPTAIPALLQSVNGARFGRAATSLELLYWASQLTSRPRYDIVYGHFGWNGLYASMLKDLGLLGGRLVTAFHGADLSWQLEASGSGFYRPLFEKGDLFLPISEHWKEKLLALGCPRDRIQVHRMGIDCARFAFLERRLAAGEPARLVSVSRLIEKKGIEYGIRAVSRLIERGRDIRYDVIGDGPLREPLTRLIAELRLGDRVGLLGWRNQDAVLEALRRSHIGLAPSVTSGNGDQEGIPVFLMESMATGLPVVSTWHSGIPELVEDGVSGRLVPERDVEALAGALDDLISHPPSWPLMGRAGRRQVEQNYDIGALNDRLADLFRGLVDAQP